MGRVRSHIMSWKFDISDTYCSSRISLDNYFSCNPYKFDNNCLAIVRSSRASPYNHLTKEGGTIIFLFISVSRFYQIQIRKLQTGRHKGRVKVELKGSEYKNQFCAFSNLKWEESFILLAKQTFFLIFVYVAQVCFSPTSVKKKKQKHTEFASFAKEIRLREGAEINGYSFHALGVASPQAGYIYAWRGANVALGASWELTFPKWLEAGLKDPPEYVLIMTAGFSCTFMKETLFYWLKMCCYVLSCIIFTEMRKKSTIWIQKD